MPNFILPRRFYERPSVVVAKHLVGMILVRTLDSGTLIGGAIAETEGYGGFDDPASHAFRGRTERNEAMFGDAGHAYVYFTYGMHYCLNVVTKPTPNAGAGAVLIRAVEPFFGLDSMLKLRGNPSVLDLTNGPARICQAFAINRSLDKIDLTEHDSPLKILRKENPPERQVLSSPRIGIKSGVANLWRFFDSKAIFVSQRKLVLT